MPNFKDDKSKFTMKNMNYYKGKHAAGEASSPYNKNGHEAMHGKMQNTGGGRAVQKFAKNFAEAFTNQIKYKKVLPEITEELVNIPVQSFLKGASEIATQKMLNRTMKKNLKKKTAGYTPQTKSRKDPSTDITPQSKKK